MFSVKKKNNKHQNTRTYTSAFSTDFMQNIFFLALMCHCHILAYCIIYCILQTCSSVEGKNNETIFQYLCQHYSNAII